MTLTLAHERRIRKPRRRGPVVEGRKKRLRAAGASYTTLARLAGVTHSMAWKWMNGERTSAACTEAYRQLTERSA